MPPDDEAAIRESVFERSFDRKPDDPRPTLLANLFSSNRTWISWIARGILRILTVLSALTVLVMLGYVAFFTTLNSWGSRDTFDRQLSTDYAKHLATLANGRYLVATISGKTRGLTVWEVDPSGNPQPIAHSNQYGELATVADRWLVVLSSSATDVNAIDTSAMVATVLDVQQLSGGTTDHPIDWTPVLTTPIELIGRVTGLRGSAASRRLVVANSVAEVCVLELSVPGTNGTTSYALDELTRWTMATREDKRRLYASEQTRVEISPDGEWVLASGDWLKLSGLWRIVGSPGSDSRQWEAVLYEDVVFEGVGFSAASDRVFKLSFVQISSSELRPSVYPRDRVLVGHGQELHMHNRMLTVVPAGSGMLVAVVVLPARRDGLPPTTQLWAYSVNGGHRIAVISKMVMVERNAPPIVVDPQGRYIVVGGDRLRWWNLPDGALTETRVAK